MDTKQDNNKENFAPYKKPMVFLFDFEDTVVEKLKELRINSYEGSLGASIRVNNKIYDEKHLKLNNNYPSNLHEFDIIMLDLTRQNSVNYNPLQHQLDNTSGDTALFLLSTYPEQVFNPRPFSVSLVSNEINDLHTKKINNYCFLWE